MKVLAVIVAAALSSVAEAADAGFCLPALFPPSALFSRPRGGGVSSIAMQAPLQRIDPPPVTLSGPVFSLATLNADGTTNMNVLTYAVPVGLKPTRTWVLSLFQGTLSHENFRTRGAGVLQLLRRRHVPLVPILGKQCGRDVNKKAASDEVRETEFLVEHKPPQGVLVCDHAGLVINKFSLRRDSRGRPRMSGAGRRCRCCCLGVQPTTRSP